MKFCNHNAHIQWKEKSNKLKDIHKVLLIKVQRQMYEENIKMPISINFAGLLTNGSPACSKSAAIFASDPADDDLVNLEFNDESSTTLMMMICNPRP